MRVIVHGGAGGSPDDPETRRATVAEAAETGATADDPLTAVVEAVGVLESDPRFNAGVGGAVQSDGLVRTDAGVMTDDRRAGAVCGMVGVEHAAEVARGVLEETPHVLLAGDRATEFAAAVGVETGRDLLTDRTAEKWREADPPVDDFEAGMEWVRERFGGSDTVGAVACEDGDLAAATSTGGRWFALAGRVGDVPQIGSGFYCDPRGGASATGAGEDIARVTLAREAVDLLAEYDPETAARRAIDRFEERTDSTAGLVLMNPDGEAGSTFNSEAMATAVATR